MTEQEKTAAEPAGATEKPAAPGAEVAALQAQLRDRDAAIAALEQAAAGKDGETAALKQAQTEADKTIGGLKDALARAALRYQEMVVRSNPEVPAELITGGTIDEIEASLKNARAIVDRVRQGMEAEAARTRVPAGAPARAPLDLSLLSPREKIQYGIGGKK